VRVVELAEEIIGELWVVKENPLVLCADRSDLISTYSVRDTRPVFITECSINLRIVVFTEFGKSQVNTTSVGVCELTQCSCVEIHVESRFLCHSRRHRPPCVAEVARDAGDPLIFGENLNLITEQFHERERRQSHASRPLTAESLTPETTASCSTTTTGTPETSARPTAIVSSSTPTPRSRAGRATGTASRIPRRPSNNGGPSSSTGRACRLSPTAIVIKSMTPAPGWGRQRFVFDNLIR
jgi:hypothetical protein